MAFCGQCGFLLLPDAVTCPRCNAAVTSKWAAVDKNANAPTIHSNPNKTQKAKNASSSNPDLVQEANQSVDYQTEAQRTEQDKHTPIPPTIQHPPSAGYHTQPPIASLPSSSDQSYMSQNSRDFSSTQRASYPGHVFPPPVFPQKTRNWVALLVTLLILFLVGATTVVLVVGPSRIIQIVRGGTTTASPATPVAPTSQVLTSVPPTPTAQSSPTSEQQAQSVIDHYYMAINSKDYQTAYNLWLNYPASYQNFANGFSDTSHDDYTFGNVVQQIEGKVQVNTTITATSTSNQQTSYQGYYIVEQQQDGSWKITSAKIYKR